jgi:protein tyrosine/serine phosphatase
MPVVFRWLVFVVLSAGATGCLPSESKYVANVKTVTPGVLIRGAQTDERGLRELKEKYGIQTVVNFNDVTNESEGKVAAKLGLNYLPLNDNPWDDKNDREMLLAFLKVMRDQPRNGPVYVHCKVGSDRGGTAVAVYRIVLCDWSADDAAKEVRAHQDWLHALYFSGIPEFLRRVERDKAQWLQWLEEIPDPPVQRHQLE